MGVKAIQFYQIRGDSFLVSFHPTDTLPILPQRNKVPSKPKPSKNAIVILNFEFGPGGGCQVRQGRVPPCSGGGGV